jgi:hypothetical protein
LKTPSFITGNDPIKHRCIVYKIRWNVKPTLFLITYQDSRHHLCGKSYHSQICRTVSQFIFNSSVISLTPNLRSELTKVPTLSTFASLLWVFGCPLLGSSCTFSCPSLNRLCHS